MAGCHHQVIEVDGGKAYSEENVRKSSFQTRISLFKNTLNRIQKHVKSNGLEVSYGAKVKTDGVYPNGEDITALPNYQMLDLMRWSRGHLLPFA